MSEENTKEWANGIAQNEKLSLKEKLDLLFEETAEMHCNLGTDSTKGEKEEVKLKCRHIYRAIKTIDDRLGRLLLNTQDK